MFQSIFADVQEALQNLPDPDICNLAEEVKAKRKAWGGILAAMDDALNGNERKKAWRWVHLRLTEAVDDPKTEADFKRITKLRHLRYALAHYLFYYGDIDNIGGYPAGTPA